MLRRMVSVATVLFVLAGFVVAGEYTGRVTEFKDGKMTVKYRKSREDKESIEKTFKVGKDVKITRKGKDGDEEVKADDYKEMVEKAAKSTEKGKTRTKGKGTRGGFGASFAKITTEGEGDSETVTKISIGFGGFTRK